MYSAVSDSDSAGSNVSTLFTMMMSDDRISGGYNYVDGIRKLALLIF